MLTDQPIQFADRFFVQSNRYFLFAHVRSPMSITFYHTHGSTGNLFFLFWLARSFRASVAASTGQEYSPVYRGLLSTVDPFPFEAGVGLAFAEGPYLPEIPIDEGGSLRHLFGRHRRAHTAVGPSAGGSGQVVAADSPGVFGDVSCQGTEGLDLPTGDATGGIAVCDRGHVVVAD